MDMPLAEALGRYLDLSTRQMAATAGNIANADTPGYKTQSLDVDAAFGQVLQSHLGPGSQALLPEPSAVGGLVSRADGNNVSMDREGLQLAQTQLQFRTGVDMLRHEYSRMLEAIKSEMHA